MNGKGKENLKKFEDGLENHTLFFKNKDKQYEQNTLFKEVSFSKMLGVETELENKPVYWQQFADVQLRIFRDKMHNLAEHLFNSRFPITLRKRREEICQGIEDLNNKFEERDDS